MAKKFQATFSTVAYGARLITSWIVRRYVFAADPNQKKLHPKIICYDTEQSQYRHYHDDLIHLVTEKYHAKQK